MAALLTIVSPAAGGSASVAAASSDTTATSLCGFSSAQHSMAPKRPLDTARPKTLVGGIGIVDVEAERGLLYVATGARTITVLQATGATVRTVDVPWYMPGSAFAVAPDGAIFVARSPSELVKLTPDGNVAWSIRQPKPITGVFGHALGRRWVAGAVGSAGSARLYDEAGRYVGSRDVQGGRFAATPDGGLLSTDGHYVRRYNTQLRQVFYFGGGGSGTTPVAGQFDFYLEGGAAQLGDGRYLVSDAGRGVELFSPRGLLLGTATEAQLGTLAQNSPVLVAGSAVFLATGKPFSNQQALSRIALSDLLREATQPGPQSPVLGIGAGINFGVPADYFSPATRVTARAVFDPWWSQVGRLTLRYTVQNAAQIHLGGGETHAALVSPQALRSGISLDLPPRAPGPYQIDARLLSGRTVIAGECFQYSVGALGDRLNLPQLPGTTDAGGVSGDRGAVLASVFGTGGVRINLDWNRLLPNGSTGPTDYAAYDAEIAAASAEAAAQHVAFSVQVGSGGPEKAFVSDGTWGARVTQLVEHWKSEVHYWEAWNEPNATFGSAANYVHEVLEPFYEAVKSADPTGQVIGGTVVGMDIAYWAAIAAAGGFRYMDVAAIHPYTGHNRSWEEQGFPQAFASLRAVMAANGAASMPVWITELAWWSNGPDNFLDQADSTVRAQLWMKVLDIPVWEYFTPQGTWGPDGLSFSLIEGNTLVKPAALGAMVEAAQTEGRAFVGWLNTGIPMTYAAEFGPRAAGAGPMVALWTDDLRVGATAFLTTTGTSRTAALVGEYGATRTVSLTAPIRLTLDGSVQYLDLPTGSAVHVASPASFGPDLALARDGSRASASSTAPGTTPSSAIDGNFGAGNLGELAGSSAWASAYGDAAPTFTVRLPRAERVDRVLLATSSVANTMPGIRTWSVAVRTPSGAWRTVGSHADLFYDRAAVVHFKPLVAVAVRIVIRRINFGGYAGGAQPWFWKPPSRSERTQPNDYLYGPAVIREVAVYAPRGGAAMVNASHNNASTARVTPEQ